eukprot:6482746-Amphidinium_carterae.1
MYWVSQQGESDTTPHLRIPSFKPEQLKKWAGVLNTDEMGERNEMAANAYWFINSSGRAGNDASTFGKCFMNDVGKGLSKETTTIHVMFEEKSVQQRRGKQQGWSDHCETTHAKGGEEERKEGKAREGKGRKEARSFLRFEGRKKMKEEVRIFLKKERCSPHLARAASAISRPGCTTRQLLHLPTPFQELLSHLLIRSSFLRLWLVGRTEKFSLLAGGGVVLASGHGSGSTGVVNEKPTFPDDQVPVNWHNMGTAFWEEMLHSYALTACLMVTTLDETPAIAAILSKTSMILVCINGQHVKMLKQRIISVVFGLMRDPSSPLHEPGLTRLSGVRTRSTPSKIQRPAVKHGAGKPKAKHKAKAKAKAKKSTSDEDDKDDGSEDGAEVNEDDEEDGDDFSMDE